MIGRAGQLHTSIYHVYQKLSVPEWQYSIFARIWRLYLSAYTISSGLFLVRMFYKLKNTFGKFFRSYSELLSKLSDISFQEYMSNGISHPVFYGDLVYNLRRVKDTPNFISSGSKTVNAFDDDSMTH